MKLTVLLELLVILIIIAYGAAKPVDESRGIKASFRQAVTAAPVESVPAAPAKPVAVADDDDDVDLLALIGADDGEMID
jgi:hypothetical protein